MVEIGDLKDWILDKGFSDIQRSADINIHFNHVDISSIVNDKPSDRKKKINQHFKECFDQLISANLFTDYKLIGTAKSPRGISTKIAYPVLEQIKLLNFIQSISIIRIDKAQKVKPKSIQHYYTIKMTVVVEIEGRTSGMQTIEERYVLIKAKSGGDACKKLEKIKNDYAEPYLNSDGQLVRWRIESFDDCYETYISNFADLNDPAGVEVFSKLQSRRLKKENTWDGK